MEGHDRVPHLKKKKKKRLMRQLNKNKKASFTLDTDCSHDINHVFKNLKKIFN
jgi:hypothetical protein